jgi:hypothetical protein
MSAAIMLGAAFALLLPAAGIAQNNPLDNGPVCGHALQGYVRLQDSAFLRRAVVEEVLEPHFTVVQRTSTDGHGRFTLPYGRRKRGTHVLLRISYPGAATALVKIKIDPTCLDPLITLLPVSPAPSGGER